MSIRMVDRAEWPPGQCAITAQSDGPFYDTGSNFPMIDGRVYVGSRGAALVAKEFDYVPRGELNEIRDLLELAQSRIVELEGEIAEADKALQAVDVLESRDFRARKKPGRPKVTTNG